MGRERTRPPQSSAFSPENFYTLSMLRFCRKHRSANRRVAGTPSCPRPTQLPCPWHPALLHGQGHTTSLPQNAGARLQQVSERLPTEPDVSWQEPLASRAPVCSPAQQLHSLPSQSLLCPGAGRALLAEKNVLVLRKEPRATVCSWGGMERSPT
ncbi:hypothetical protein DV515_00014597, partial [Chloebia gouldiae]